MVFESVYASPRRQRTSHTRKSGDCCELDPSVVAAVQFPRPSPGSVRSPTGSSAISP